MQLELCIFYENLLLKVSGVFFFNLLELCLLVPFSDLNCVFLGFFTTLFSDASLELCVMPKDEDILQLVSFHLGANDFISLKNSRV